MRLLRAELGRFVARRATRWIVVLALVILAIGLAIAANHSKIRNQNVGQSCVTVNNVVRCNPDVARVDDRIMFHDHLRDAITGSGIALLLLSVLLGATFVGADYVGGALGGQLLFEPRRTRVFVVKALAIAIGVFVIVVVLLALLTGGLYLVADTRGVVGHLDSTWWTRRGADVARVAGACAVMGAVAFSITTLARRTVAAVVGFLAFTAILEPILSHSVRFFDGRLPVTGFIGVVLNDFGDNPPKHLTTIGAAVVSAALWSAVFLLVGGVVFRRREIR